MQVFNSITSGTSVSASVGARLGSSQVLQLTRRLDWRFLLHQPNLGRVGYFGPPCQLLSALQTFSDSVTVFSEESLGPVYQRFDTAVLRYPSLRTVEIAGKYVRPGGSIYLELLGRLGKISNRNIAPRSISGLMKYVRALWICDFAEVEPYWHRPGFEECHEIVPLFDRVAMAYALSRGGPTNFGREMKMMASRCLLRTGLLPGIVPCYSIVAEKQKEVRTPL